MQLQIFVPLQPEPFIPPPPPMPPATTATPRRRRNSRPAPTYDLATLIEIKDALENLEVGLPDTKKYLINYTESLSLSTVAFI